DGHPRQNPAYRPATETPANAGVSICPCILGKTDAEACLALPVNVVRTGGLEIAYERVGEGPPLAFVHGAGEDGRVWQPQLAALADEFTVVAWDEPGAGRSSDVPADFGLTEYANCLAALIDAVELGP